MEARRVTSADVAGVAGVSRSAVSRTFTPGASVAGDTRRRVLEAAKELGYQPNAIARMLNKRNSEIVGVMLGSLTNPFLSNLSALLLSRLQASEFRPLLFQASTRAELASVLPTVLQYQPTAILVTGLTPAPELAVRCRDAGAPVIVLNRAPGSGYPGVCIGTDHRRGGRLAAEALIDAGYRRIAMIVGDRTMSTHRERRSGLVERLGELGVELHATVDGAFTHRGGFEAALGLLTSRERPDALFCSGDVLAFGALDAARYETKLTISEQVGILGFDDVPMAAWPAYDLSTIRQPVDRIVDEAVETLQILRAPLPPASAVTLLAPTFVQRGTTRPGYLLA